MWKTQNRILELLDKDTDKGIITAEQTADAIVKLENEIERRKMIEAQEKADRERIEKEEQERREREKEEGKEEDDEKESERDEKKKSPDPNPKSVFLHGHILSFQLLKAANKKKKDIYWGVQT